MDHALKHKATNLVFAGLACVLLGFAALTVYWNAKQTFPSAGRFGYIDRTGAFVIPPHYEFAYDFSEGCAAVRIENRTGFIDRDGEIAIPH